MGPYVFSCPMLAWCTIAHILGLWTSSDESLISEPLRARRKRGTARVSIGKCGPNAQGLLQHVRQRAIRFSHAEVRTTHSFNYAFASVGATP